MEFDTCLKNLTLIYEYLCLFLLFMFGLRKFYFDWFPWSLVKFVADSNFGGKWGEINRWFCLKNVLEGTRLLVRFSKSDSNLAFTDETEGEMEEKLNLFPGSDDESDAESKDDFSEMDVSQLRELIKIEKYKVDMARGELEKERAASASAAEEAMSMILRLQSEKSFIELEANHYRRLAAEKQVHDQEVIQSLQWLVWNHESERDVLEQQLKSCRRKLNRCSKNDESGDQEHIGFGDLLEDVHL